MASISIIVFPGWGNLVSHCQAPLYPLRRLGAVRQCVCSSPFFVWRVRAHGLVHPRFLMRPRLLTRLYPLLHTVPKLFSISMHRRRASRLCKAFPEALGLCHA